MVVLKKLDSLTISNDLLKRISNKLTYFIENKKEKVLNLNRNLGSYQECHDYAQEVLICVLKKLKNNEIVFYSEHQLWTYCFRVLEMLLLKQHRDYSKVKSKTATLIDIDMVYETTGKTLDDLIGFQKFNIYETPEYLAFFNSYKDFFICINEETVSITSVLQLYKVDINSRFINLYNFIEKVNNLGIKKTLKFYQIEDKQKFNLFDNFKKFFLVKNNKTDKTFLYSINTELSSRDKNLINKFKQNKNAVISIEKFKKLVRR